MGCRLRVKLRGAEVWLVWFVFLVPALETRVFTLVPPLAPLAAQSYLAPAKFCVKVSSVTLRAGE